MKLTDIHVDRYGPLPRLAHECEDNFEVFYGPNESGKTLLLEAVLKLLAPDIDSTLPHVSRVDESPTGHVVVETNGTEQKLGDGTVLGDIADLSPRHLRNIFVVRDSDLRLEDEHDFYDSVTQQIGDLHTNEIDAIQSNLVETGRLTSVGGRGLSSARSHENAADVRDNATDLATDIHDYVTEAQTNDIAATEREFVAVKTELQQCESALAVQEAAKTWDTHSTLTERLETYTEATEQLDDEVSQSTLEQLEEFDREIAEADDEINDLEDKRSTLREERTQFETEKESVDAEVTPLEKRADDVDSVKRALDSFRDTRGESIGASRGMAFARYVALAGIGLGGVAAVLGSTVAGVLLAVIGGVAAGWYGLQHRSITAAEREREQVLQQARDAGLDVSVVDEIGAAVRAFHDELESLQDRRDELERKIEVKEELITECDEELQTERQDRRANREKKQELLQQADVANIDEYRERVNTSAELERKRDQAAQSLTDALGIPPGDDPTEDGKIRYWESELDAMVSELDESVTADEYDSTELADLREEYEQLQQRRDDLNDQLEVHERRLRELDDRIQAISARPFLDVSVTLQSRSVEGLQEVAQDLDQLVNRIERDADIAREALDIFDEIQTEEEQKITDLFGEDSRAAEVFRTITDDRYTGVTYDAVEQVLQVQRNGHEVLTPQQLSHGTTEQLYLAARVGLAEQLLSSEPGFFILDDAFLPADRTRLQDGFEVLRELAEDGWQILYFTAKDEVGTDLVDTHNLRCRTLDRLG
jgi:uncharacterized protein YhaN